MGAMPVDDNDGDWWRRLFSFDLNVVDLPLPEAMTSAVRRCCCLTKRQEVSIEKYRLEWPTAPDLRGDEASPSASTRTPSARDGEFESAPQVSNARIVFGSSLGSAGQGSDKSTPKWVSVIPKLSLAEVLRRDELRPWDRARYAQTERRDRMGYKSSTIRSHSEGSRSSSVFSSALTASIPGSLAGSFTAGGSLAGSFTAAAGSSVQRNVLTPLRQRRRDMYSPTRIPDVAEEAPPRSPLALGEKAQAWLASRGVSLAGLTPRGALT